MGQQQSSGFYDARLRQFTLPYDETPWKPVYEACADMVLALGAGPILDVGCGTGRMGEALRRRGFLDYHGVDFSPARVAAAQAYLRSGVFDVMDVTAPEAAVCFDRFRRFIVTEFLEHVDADRDVLAMMPSGAAVVLSVPNYDCDGHVRTFGRFDDAVARYGDLLNFGPGQRWRWSPPSREGKIIFVMSGLRR